MIGKALCLDLDGTLFDTVPEMCEAANQVLAELGLPLVAESDARDYVGDGLPRFMKRVLTGQIWGEPDDHVFQQSLLAVQESYSRLFLSRDCLYPGVAETLEMMQEAGWRLAVVTNKPERFAQPLLDAFLPKIQFGCAIGGDSGLPRKPSPAQLQEALRRLGVSPDEAVMVGDSIADAEASRSANVAAMVAATYGYHGRTGIDRLQADYHIASFIELPDICKQIWMY